MITQTPAVPAGPIELDILQHVAVRVPCGTCGRYYDVTLRQVLLAQVMLHAGCPAASDTECPPLTYAAVADEAAVRDFERSWRRVTQQVNSIGLDLTLCESSLTN
ncbi:MAG TPA: hypothetical protein PLH72_05555 [Vicinamibacterales bacterium]|nr:hypothetical protein [Vicinamibacterales bacterium]